MKIYLYFKSGTQYELIPQIRLTCSKDGTTGTAVCEVTLNQRDDNFKLDPIYNVGLKIDNSLRMADICQFVWCAGNPIKIIAIFLFSDIYEKHNFFDYYPNYALNNRLEFFPAVMQEKSVTDK